LPQGNFFPRVYVSIAPGFPRQAQIISSMVQLSRLSAGG
jgi:hypothetical protein